MEKEDEYEEVRRKANKVMELKRQIREIEKDERVKGLVWNWEKWEIDRNMARARAYRKGLVIGMLEVSEDIENIIKETGFSIKEIKEIEKENKEKIEKEKQRIKESKEKMVKELLEMNISDEDIAEVTSLNIEEVKKYKEK